MPEQRFMWWILIGGAALFSSSVPLKAEKPADAAMRAAQQGPLAQRGAVQDALQQVIGVLLASDSAAKTGNGAEPIPDMQVGGASPAGTSASDGPPSGSLRMGVTGTVDVHVSRMPVTDVLRMIAEQTRRNIVASKSVNGLVSADLYGVTLERALEAILLANGFVFRQKGDLIYVCTREELAESLKAENEPIIRVFRLRYVSAKDAEVLVAPLLSAKGKTSKTPQAAEGLGDGGSSGASGGSSGGKESSSGGNSHADAETLVVFDERDRVEQIARVLKDFDVPPQQVLVEATILRAQLTEDNGLGIDFTTVAGIDFQELSSVSPGVQSISTGAVPAGRLNDTTMTTRTNFNSAIASGGFTFGIIKDQISLFIRALEQITDVSVLANPKVLALNKQKGEVIVGRRDGYLTTTITETTAVQTVEFLETGTRLIFRPYVCEDGQIRMEIHPEDSTGGITAANLPFKQTTEVTTNIMVHDGHTIVIGGLFREVGSTTRGQVPGLGNLPIAGALFRSTNDRTVREEIIILLTVHLVKGEREERAGQEAVADVERYRIGQRRAAQWFGRERISQAHYRWALQNAARGDTSKALWDTEMAIRNNPHQLQAFELREQLRQKRSWDEDGSAVRQHLYELISEENGTKKAPYGRPAPPFPTPGADESRVQETPAAKPGPSPTSQPARETQLEMLDTQPPATGGQP